MWGCHFSKAAVTEQGCETLLYRTRIASCLHAFCSCSACVARRKTHRSSGSLRPFALSVDDRRAASLLPVCTADPEVNSSVAKYKAFHPIYHLHSLPRCFKKNLFPTNRLLFPPPATAYHSVVHWCERISTENNVDSSVNTSEMYRTRSDRIFLHMHLLWTVIHTTLLKQELNVHITNMIKSLLYE